MTETFNNKRLLSPFGLQDVDQAFYDWFDKKLNIHLLNRNGEKKKVPVRFVSPERWSIAREEGIRDEHGTLILPIIAISRNSVESQPDGPYGRGTADNGQELVYAKEIDKKSSVVSNLLAEREYNVDPNFPIYEVYTVPVADHYQLGYTVSVWVSYMDELNQIIEKLGQELNFVSVKSFQFSMPNGLYFRAFQETSIRDESNSDDFSQEERIIRQEYEFTVPAYLLPESDERRKRFKRYFTQTKIVIKEETDISEELLRELLKK